MIVVNTFIALYTISMKNYEIKKSKNIIYLDNAATTRTDPQVLKAMQPYWTQEYGNPSSLYKSGVTAKMAIDNARSSIAHILNCTPKEIIFTSSGTESINLAIFGVAREFEINQKRKGHIITSSIEHHAVLHSVRALKEEGWHVDYTPVNADGLIINDALKKLVRKDTVLISIMYANNEIGTIQPIAEIGKWLTGLNKKRVEQKLPLIRFHTDACQASGSLSLDTHELHVDMLSINGSKIYGPKGAGVLFVKSGATLRPLIFGGGQERNLRSGTENVTVIVGFAKALTLAQNIIVKENKRLIMLQSYFNDRLLKKVNGFILNGPNITYDTNTNQLLRLPNNINITIKGVENESLMLYLDAFNIQVATGSACTTASNDPSHVLEAIGLSDISARQSIRLTLGRHTSKKELDYVLKVIPNVVKQLRKTTNEN